MEMFDKFKSDQYKKRNKEMAYDKYNQIEMWSRKQSRLGEKFKCSVLSAMSLVSIGLVSPVRTSAVIMEQNNW